LSKLRKEIEQAVERKHSGIRVVSKGHEKMELTLGDSQELQVGQVLIDLSPLPAPSSPSSSWLAPSSASSQEAAMVRPIARWNVAPDNHQCWE